MGEWKSTTGNNLYNFLECYDIAFDRDVSSEAAFLNAIFERNCDHPLRCSLNLLCGPGYHASDMARRGIDAIGLDWAVDVESDTRTQTAEILMELRVTENGRTRTMRHRIRESFPTPPFLEAVARLSGVLEPIAWYGDFDLKQPYDDSQSSKHCISIYRRPRAPETHDGDRMMETDDGDR